MGRKGAIAPLAMVYVALYGAYGSESPFLPSFLAEREAGSTEIGVIMAAGTLVRIVAGPAVGFLADRRRAPVGTLAVSAGFAGLVSFAYLGANGFWPLLLVAMIHAVAIAGLAPISDAIALACARRDRFPYGWVRGIGSAAFVLGTLVSGQLIAVSGLPSIVVLSGILFVAMAAALLRLPVVAARSGGEVDAATARTIIGDARFRRLVLVASLVIGSHAVNDAFGVIHWRAAGIGPGVISLLWSTAVMSEIVVFLLIGPWALARWGPGRAMVVAAACGILRWAVMAGTTALPALFAAQLGHGLTFALLHLAVMRLIETLTPAGAASTAQTLYGTFGLGIASAILTLAAGLLYARFGVGAYLYMAALCGAAIPFALTLPVPRRGA